MRMMQHRCSPAKFSGVRLRKSALIKCPPACVLHAMYIITQPGNARKKPWPSSGRCAALSWASLFVKGNQRFSKAFHFARKMPGKAEGRQQTGIRIESESRGRLKSDPRQSRGLRKPCRQASQEALNTLSFASPAPPPPVNGIPPIACCISLVLNTIPLRSKPAAKALLLSPAQPRGLYH